MDARYDVLDDAARLAREFVDGLAERPVGATASVAELRARLARPLTDGGEDPRAVIADLAADVEPGLIASAGPALLRLRHRRRAAGRRRRRLARLDAGTRTPAATRSRPALTVAEERRGGLGARAARPARRLRRRLRHGLPDGARHLPGGGAPRRAARRAAGTSRPTACRARPALRVVAGAHAHVTVALACRILGLGGASASASSRPTRRGGCSRPSSTPRCASTTGRRSSCAQAGEVNTGAFDPLARDRRHRAARTARGATSTAHSGCGPPPARAPALLAGFERADSWATDGHKWLNVPYDCGIAIVADAAAQRAAMGLDGRRTSRRTRATSRGASSGRPSSRAARAASRSTPRCARSGATASPTSSTAAATSRSGSPRGWREDDGVEILNDVVLNQVLVRFGDDDDVTDAVIERVQREGTCWPAPAAGTARP